MNYFILQNNESKGPFSLNQLKGMWNNGTITGNMRYCEQGGTEWLPLEYLQPQLEPDATFQQLSPQSQELIRKDKTLVRVAKTRGTFIILGLFFGCLGIHNFYANYNKKGAVQLIITLALGWTVIGLIITMIWALIEICTIKHDGLGGQMS